MKLSIVVPCYNEEEALLLTHQVLVSLFADLVAKNLIEPEGEIIYVDDGSVDRTWEIIERLQGGSDLVSGLKLSRNVGHQRALLAGLFNASGDAVISIDADLQDDVTVIEQMIIDYHSGSEIVYGIRAGRPHDTFFKRASARYFYQLMGFLGAPSKHNHADFRLMSQRAIESLKSFKEANIYLRGMVPLIGLKHSFVEYKRSQRNAGTTKYTLGKMISLALEGITSFSTKPLRIITVIGLSVFIVSLILTLWVLWIKFQAGSAMPGWASTALPIYFLGGIQLFCIGILGEYIGKIYQEVKARPRYIVEKKI